MGAAVAAYSLPGAAGAVALRRWLRGRRGARLVFVNAVRASALGLIGCLALAGRLDPAGYVPLLGTVWVLGWGLALIPFGLPTPLWAGLAAFFAGAAIWGPCTPLSMAVFQDATPPVALASVIAALGASGTLLGSGLATTPLGLLTVAVLARARKERPSPAGSPVTGSLQLSFMLSG